MSAEGGGGHEKGPSGHTDLHSGGGYLEALAEGLVAIAEETLDKSVEIVDEQIGGPPRELVLGLEELVSPGAKGHGGGGHKESHAAPKH